MAERREKDSMIIAERVQLSMVFIRNNRGEGMIDYG